MSFIIDRGGHHGVSYIGTKQVNRSSLELCDTVSHEHPWSFINHFLTYTNYIKHIFLVFVIKRSPNIYSNYYDNVIMFRIKYTTFSIIDMTSVIK